MTVEPRPLTDAADPDAGTSDLLRRTADLAIAYREALPERPVAPSVGYDQLYATPGGPLPEVGEGAEAVIELLGREVPPGLIAMPGPRFFGFVLGGGLPAAVAADWLTSVWDQNSPFAGITPAPAINWWTRETDVDRSLDAMRRCLAASPAAG